MNRHKSSTKLVTLFWALLWGSLACLASFFIGSGVGYNYGLSDQLPEARVLLEQAQAERRRIRNLTASARRASGDL
jgi:hypothetical protein